MSVHGAFAVVGHLRSATRAGVSARSATFIGHALDGRCTLKPSTPRAHRFPCSGLVAFGALGASRALGSGAKARSVRSSGAFSKVAVARAWLQMSPALALRLAQRPGRRSVRAPASPVRQGAVRFNALRSSGIGACLVRTVPSARLCPNLSFERTSNGEARLRFFPSAFAPLAAAQLQR